jgi:hypothetical protein
MSKSLSLEKVMMEVLRLGGVGRSLKGISAGSLVDVISSVAGT